jgi:hypothetical protein
VEILMGVYGWVLADGKLQQPSEVIATPEDVDEEDEDASEDAAVDAAEEAVEDVFDAVEGEETDNYVEDEEEDEGDGEEAEDADAAEDEVMTRGWVCD